MRLTSAEPVPPSQDLDRALRRRLSGLDAPQRAAVTALAERWAARFAPLPSKGLRELARHLGPQAAQAFVAGADGELWDEVDRRAEEFAVRAARELRSAIPSPEVER